MKTDVLAKIHQIIESRKASARRAIGQNAASLSSQIEFLLEDLKHGAPYPGKISEEFIWREINSWFDYVSQSDIPQGQSGSWLFGPVPDYYREQVVRQVRNVVGYSLGERLERGIKECQISNLQFNDKAGTDYKGLLLHLKNERWPNNETIGKYEDTLEKLLGYKVSLTD